MSTLEVLLIALLLLIITYIVLIRRRKNLPPGPKSLPIIGNLFDFSGSKQVYKDFLKYRLKYGDVVRLSYGPNRDFILVFGHEAIHKGLVEQGNDFKFRPRNLYLINKLFDGKGVLFGNGEIHQKLRKFTVEALTKFGLGKKSLEERIQDEARILADELESYGGQSRDIRITLKEAVANITIGIVYGSRLDYGDPDFLMLIKNTGVIYASIAAYVPENFLPFLAYLPNSKTKQVLKAAGEMTAYAKRKIKEHRETFDSNNIRDFVDLYLKAEQHGDGEVLTEENMFRDIVDLTIAGTEATYITLTWAILYLINNPDVQDKCRKEIKDNVGSERAVSQSDKKQLPYLDATIKETLRLASIVPLGIPHTVLKDTQFEGYTIPKDSTVIFHISSVLADPNLWKRPYEFHPERFLTEEGKKDAKDVFIPFSLGPRLCPGKPLATTELFLFLGNLLQRFTFKIPPGCQRPSLERVHMGITCQPHPFEVCMVPN